MFAGMPHQQYPLEQILPTHRRLDKEAWECPDIETHSTSIALPRCQTSAECHHNQMLLGKRQRGTRVHTRSHGRKHDSPGSLNPPQQAFERQPHSLLSKLCLQAASNKPCSALPRSRTFSDFAAAGRYRLPQNRPPPYFEAPCSLSREQWRRG